MTRPSTPKFDVVHVASGTVAVAHVSKTEAKKLAREMSGDRKGSVVARPSVVTRPDVSKLEFFVLCKSTYPFFETIAAFDCKPPALNCAADYRAGTFGERFTYKVVDAEGREVVSWPAPNSVSTSPASPASF
jgi:hypothetical protein